MKIIVATLVTALLPVSVVHAAKAPAKAGDYNGDGRVDATVAVPWGDGKNKGDHGVVAVLYGGSRKKQTISASSPGVKSVAPHGRAFGSAATSADFDGDGYADLAIAGSRDFGITLVYGSAKGLSSRAAFLKAGAFNSSSNGLATGDLDRNGKPDLVVSRHGTYWIFMNVGRGKVTASPLQPPPDSLGNPVTSIKPVIADFTGDGYPDLALSSSLRLGSAKGLGGYLSVSTVGSSGPASGPEAKAGDINGDGRADLVLSGVSVLYGTPGGLSKPRSFNGASPGVPGPATDYFGSSVAVTDINRDGYADIATGSPDASPAGNVIVLYGSKNGLVTKGAQLFTQNTKGVPGRNEDGDDFGARVTFADISGDRRLDLIVGSPGEDRNHGRIYVLPNAKGRITGKGSLPYDREFFGITAPRSRFGWFFG